MISQLTISPSRSRCRVTICSNVFTHREREDSTSHTARIRHAGRGRHRRLKTVDLAVQDRSICLSTYAGDRDPAPHRERTNSWHHQHSIKRTQLVVGGPPLSVIFLGALAPFSCGSKDTWRRHRSRRQTYAKTNWTPRWRKPKPRFPSIHQRSRENSSRGRRVPLQEHTRTHLPFRHKSNHQENPSSKKTQRHCKKRPTPSPQRSTDRIKKPVKRNLLKHAQQTPSPLVTIRVFWCWDVDGLDTDRRQRDRG